MNKFCLIPVYYCFGLSGEDSQEAFQKYLCNEKIYEVSGIKKTHQKNMTLVTGQKLTKSLLYSLWLSTVFFSSYILWVVIVLKSIKEFLGKHFHKRDMYKVAKTNAIKLSDPFKYLS